MIEKIKESFAKIDLPDEITWLTDDWMVWSPKKYVEFTIFELEKNPNERRKRELIHDLRRLYKALKDGRKKEKDIRSGVEGYKE